MTFQDVFKKSFLEGFAETELGTKEIVVVLLATSLLSLYIFFCYRFMSRRTFYSKSFNISLVGVALVTAAIILTIQSSVVVSLGMVGALSIIRFRTAVKDPMDLVFLYWSISVGIICGAGLVEIAVLTSIVITILLLLLDHLPISRPPKLLVIHAAVGEEVQHQIQSAVQECCRYQKEKTRTITGSEEDLIFEIRVRDGVTLTEKISAIPGVTSVSLVDHDGETAL